MSTRLKRPSAPMVISAVALVVALGGTSYAASRIQTEGLGREAVTSGKIADGMDRLGGTNRMDGADGVDGADGTGR